MAETLNLSGPPDPDPSSLNDQSVSSRSSNRSLRVAEKERKKTEAEDPFVLALKYFSDGRTQTQRSIADCADTVTSGTNFPGFIRYQKDK